MLVERAVSVLLVDYPHHRRVFCAIGQIHVQVIAVSRLRAGEVAVVGVQRRFPLSAIGRGAGANGALRVLDGNVHALYADTAHLVVSGGLLPIGRLRGVVQRRGSGFVGGGVEVGADFSFDFTSRSTSKQVLRIVVCVLA